ncbi:MAG TPA: zinc ABC transporter substrate-binding protein [Acidimicrobiales bacterium]|nr:zinc ABC transporter substrate-binding protein [Acidimicrobiales bacterium]
MRPAAALALAVSLVASACAGADGAADGGKVRVVAGFYPLAEAAERVGGDRVVVTNLTPAGAEPHDLELRSSDIDRIEDAALVLYLGGGFQPAVEEAAGRADGEVVDLLAPAGGVLEGSTDDGDPHVWLDPVLMARIAERVRTALVRADPAGRATYEANADAYTADITAIDTAYRHGLDECERRVIVTSHAAFGHLARRYGLTEEAITGLSPESEPDPQRLSELAARVRDEDITTIFFETLVSPRVAETLARETGARTAVLDPIEGLTDEEQARGRTYESAMTDNLSALRQALGCR